MSGCALHHESERGVILTQPMTSEGLALLVLPWSVPWLLGSVLSCLQAVRKVRFTGGQVASALLCCTLGRTERGSGLLRGARTQTVYGDYLLTMPLLVVVFVPVPMLTPLLINYFSFFLPPRCLVPSVGTHAAERKAVAPKPVFYSQCVFKSD